MRCTTALLPLLIACSSLEPEDTPTPRELVASLRHLRADDPTIETLHVQGRLKAERFGVKVELRTKLYMHRLTDPSTNRPSTDFPPDSALYVFDVRDGTPIIVVSNGAGFVYDALQGVLHWARPAFPRFEFVAQRTSPGLNDVGFIWGIDHRDRYGIDRRDRPTLEISIDLPSIAQLAPLDRTVHRLTERRFRLVSASPEGATLTIDFLKDGDGRYSPTRLEVRPNDANAAVMLLDKIAINGEIPCTAFIGLDPVDRWEKAAPLRDLGGGDPSKQPLTKLAIVTSLALRGVMRDATGSDELPDGTRLNWKELREQDARIASQLQRALAHAQLEAGR